MTAYLAVDVGGSHIACARVRGGTVEGRREMKLAAPTSLAAVLPVLEAHLTALHRGAEPVKQRVRPGARPTGDGNGPTVR